MVKWNWNSNYWLILIAPSLYIFYLTKSWQHCIPLSEISPYLHIMREDTIPDGSTCFHKNHMSYLTFSSIPFTEKSGYYINALILLELIFIALMMRPGWELMKFWMKEKSRQ